MQDTIYNGKYKEALREKFPQAVIKDTNTQISSGSFSFEIDDKFKDEYYSFLIKKEFVGASLGFEQSIMNREGREYLKNLVGRIKKETLII